MPELPDVEIFRRYLSRTAIGATVEKSEIHDADLLAGVTAQLLQRRLKNARLKTTRRHGKHLFVKLDDNGWLRLHFGMTGYLTYYKSDDEAPTHIKLLLRLKNGHRLAYSCPRTFGEIGYTDDVETYLSDNDLGPDAWDKNNFTLEDFRKVLADRGGSIKAALMDQSRVAGIGNIYSDEILFHANIHPETECDKLDAAASRRTFSKLRQVLETAIDKRVNPDDFPPGYLLGHRDEGADCPRRGCGGTIRRDSTSGRGYYYCDTHQEKLR